MWSCKKGLRGGLILQMQCHIGHQSNQDNFKQHMLENSCFLASPGSFPHRQVLQVQKIQKFSLLLCSDSHPLWQPVCFTVLPFWLAQGLLLTATLLGTFLLAAVSLLLSPGTSTCRVRKVTFPFFIVVAVLSHFSLQKQILSTYLLLNFSIFPAFHTHLAPLQCHYGRLFVFFFPIQYLNSACYREKNGWFPYLAIAISISCPVQENALAAEYPSWPTILQICLRQWSIFSCVWLESAFGPDFCTFLVIIYFFRIVIQS